MQPKCTCGKQFTVEHVFSCMQRGFPALHHNDIRDITARYLTERMWWLSQNCNHYQRRGSLHFKTSKVDDGAQLDIRAQGFWGDKLQGAFLM